jgi:putative FmdB family regulatory protein
MPNFAYRCRGCGNQFQTLVRFGETPVCEPCHCVDLDQQLSLIATPNKGGNANTEVNARSAGMGDCACGESVCPAIGLGQQACGEQH